MKKLIALLSACCIIFTFVISGDCSTFGNFTTVGSFATLANPFDIQFSLDGKFAAVSQRGAGSVRIFAVDQTTGVLTLVNDFSSGINPEGFTYAPNNLFAAVANSGSDTVLTYTTDSITGVLTPAGSAVGGPSGVSSLAFSSSSLFLAAVGPASTTGIIYSVDSTTGELTASSSFTTLATPTSITYSPDGRFVAVVSNATNSVQVFAVDQTTGVLTLVNNFSTQTGPQSVAYSPDGRFAAVTNLVANTLSLYSVDQVTGNLTNISTVATPLSAPYAIAYSPDGYFASVTNQNSGTVQVFSVDQTTGQFTAVNEAFTQNSPLGIAYSPNAQFAAVANNLSNSVTVYRTNNFAVAEPTAKTTLCSQPITFTPNDCGSGVMVTAVGVPVSGAASFSGNTITYTPNSGFSGIDTFSYTVQDVLGNTSSSTVSITVTPVAQPTSVITTCGHSVTFTPNDCGTGITILATGAPVHGSATFTATTITYTPTANYSGLDSFTYTIRDSLGNQSSNSVNVTVNPTANSVTAGTLCSTPVTFTPIVCGTGLSITAVSSPSHGSATFTATTITYTPTANYSGPDSFDYTVTDSSGDTSTAQITLTVNPVASPASVTTPCSTPLTFTPLVCGSDLVITAVTSPAHGAATFTATTITYTPTANYSGPDNFTYTITDSLGSTSTATITVSVTPVASPVTTTTPCSTSLIITPTRCGTSTTIISRTSPAHGTTTFTGTTITYTPTANYSGPDSFTYTIRDSSGSTNTATITITVNPIASAATTTTLCSQPVTVTPSLCGTGVGVTSTTTPAHGTTSFTATTITYTPTANYSGPDSFDYTITDSSGNTSTATITVTVLPVAEPTSITTDCSQTIVFSPDECGTGITITDIGPTSNGVATFTGNTITYIPNSGFSGPDDLTYTIVDSSGNISDSVIDITINPVAFPTTVTTSCSSSTTFTPTECGAALSVTSVGTPAHGTASFLNNTITYTPTANYSGPDSFTYTVTDIIGNTDTSTVNVTVAPSVQTVPVIATCGQTASFTPSICGSGVNIISVNQPSHGTASVAANIISYTPTIGYVGGDSFTYTIQDSSGTTATGTVVINVSATDSITDFTTTCGTLTVITPLTCNSGQTITSVSSPSHGSALFIGNSITYKPSGNYSGLDSFTYTFNDGVTTGTGTVDVTITPVAGFTNRTMFCSQVLTFTPNDCGTNLVITALGTPLDGTATAVGNTVTYTPTANFSGVDNFTYTITDGIGNTSSSVIRITVLPTASVTTETTPCSTPITFTPDTCGSSVVVTGVGRALHGKATFSGSLITYTPTVNFSGNDSFFYLIKDALGNTAHSIVNVAVTPVAQLTSKTTACSQAITFTPNECGTGLNVIATGNPAHGTASFLNNTITYTPTANFSGDDSFGYTIQDSSGRTSSSTVAITVTPIAQVSSTTTQCSTASTFTPNECGTGITVSALGTPSHGTATFTGNSITYTPTTNYSGPDSFTYTITDSSGRTSSSTITAVVTPVAFPTNITTPCSQNLTFTPTECGTGITISATTAPAHGTTTFTGNTITYRPTAGYSGPDSFTYTIRDSSGRTSSSTVNVIVTPLARATSVNTPCSTPLTFTPNDCGTGVAVTSIGVPLHGSATFSGNSITYTPTTNYSGPDSFSYTITDSSGRTSSNTITVSVRPVASPTSVLTSCNTNAVFTPVECGSTISITAVGTPAHGTVVSFANNSITYRPTTGYSGPDSFTYTIRDGAGNTSSSTVNVVVAPTALPTTVTTLCSQAITFTPSECGTSANISVSSISSPAHGTATFTGNSITYTPITGYSGPDGFTYTITDSFGNTTSSTITVQVNPVASPISVVTACEQDTVFDPIICGSSVAITAVSTPAHGTATFTSSAITYTPMANYNGLDSFTYTITDSFGNTSTATVSVRVLGTAQITDVSTPCSTPVSFTPLVCGSSTIVVAVGTPSHGTATFTSSTITYVPTNGYSGTDSFEYTIEDVVRNRTSTSTINVVVTPVASPTTITTPCSQAVTFTPSECGTGITISSLGTPLYGSATFTGNIITYTPDSNYSGPDSFSYTISDAIGNTSSSIISLSVQPIASPTSIVTDCGSALTFMPNECGTGITILATGQATHGTVTFTGNSITYTPDSNYSGPDSFEYTIRDGSGNISSSQVAVQVNPVASSGNITTNCDEPTVFSPMICGSTAVITAVTPPAHGNATFTDTTITYTPNSNYNGPDNFNYTVTDSSGTTSTATITVYISGVAEITDVTTACSTPILFTPLICGSSTRIIAVGTPLQGSATFTDTTITYTPTNGYSGPDSFTYTIEDNVLRISTSTINVTVTPTAAAANIITQCEQPLTFTPDTCGSNISITGLTSPTNGTATFTASTITYTPHSSYSGTDSFTYTITDGSGNASSSTVAVQVNPVALPTSTITDCSTEVTLVPDECGLGIIVSSVGAPAHGSATFMGNTVTYTPHSNYSGPDSFTYTITDVNGNTANSTVSVVVSPVASPANIVVTCEQVTVFTPMTCGSNTAITSVTTPSHGTASFTSTMLTYTPDLNYNGLDSFEYTITDSSGFTSTATISITVLASGQITSVTTSCNTLVSFTPLVCGSSTELIAVGTPAHGTVSFIGNTITYIPNTGYSGLDQLSYTIRDTVSGQTSTSTIDITVTPTAEPASVTTLCEEAVAVIPDTCGTGITVSSAGTPLHGSATFTGNSITYTPDSNYSGPDSFSYTIIDSSGQLASSTVSVLVNPRALLTNISTQCGQPVNFVPDDCGSNLIITSAGPATNGTVIFDANSITYSPNNNFSGNDNFAYTIQDGSGNTSNSTVHIQVNPVASSVVIETDCGQLGTTTPVVCGTDTIISAVSTPTHGVAAFTATTITYLPNDNYSGLDSFTYTVQDNAGGTSTAPVTVTVLPVAQPTTVTTTCDQSITFNPDTCGSNITISTTGLAAHGVVSFVNDTLTYTPNDGYSGPDSFAYTIVDGLGNASSSQITVQVVPTALPTSTITDCGQAVAFTPNECGSAITIESAANALHGTISFTGNTLTYTPDDGYSGPDSFNYTIVDGSGSTSSSQVSVTVNPVAQPASATTVCGESVQIMPIECGLDILIDSVSTPLHGVSGFVNNTITYIPDNGYSGPDSFTYTIQDSSGNTASSIITITVLPLAQPIAITTNCSSAITFTPNECGSGISVIATSQAAHGTVSFVANTITYTPDNGYSGPDSFNYTIIDSFGNTSSSQVQVTVTPTAAPAILIASCDQPVAVTPQTCGSDTVIIGTSPSSHGTVLFTPDAITYTPDAGYSGPDSFTYTIQDSFGNTATALVQVTVTSSGQVTDVTTNCSIGVTFTPLACSSTDQIIAVGQPAYGTATFTSTTITYIPTSNYSGPDSFTFTIRDINGDTFTSTINVTVLPVAQPTNIATNCGQSIIFTPNECGSDLAIVSTGLPAHGTSSFVNNTITYTPEANYSGPDSFSYTIVDSSGNTSSSQITVQVAPTALPTSTTTDCGQPITFTPNECGSAITIESVASASHGTISFTGNTLTYTPEANYSGPDSFNYTIVDGSGNTSSSQVSVTVNPVAQPTSTTTVCSESVEIMPIECGSDILIDSVSTPLHGVSGFVNNTITYTPDTNYSGPDSFSYTIVDSFGNTATVPIQVVVTPQAYNTNATTTCGKSVVFVPDECGLNITITDVENPLHGTAVFNNNTITYTPDSNYSGPDSFSYVIKDALGNTDQATIDIKVIPAAYPLNIIVCATQSLTFIPETCGTNVVLTKVSKPAHGTAVITENAITYTADNNYSGPDSFSYTITDGFGNTATALISVDVVADTIFKAHTTCGKAVTFEPQQCGEHVTIVDVESPQHGRATFTESAITYKPNPNFSGTDKFLYTYQTATGAVFTYPLKVIVKPAARPTQVEATCNNVKKFIPNTCGADTTLIAVSQPKHGVITFDKKTITYKPNPNFSGVDRCSYTIRDKDGRQSKSFIVITVKPRAFPVHTTTLCSTDTTIQPSICGTGRIISTGKPQHGSAEIIDGRTIRYSPKKKFSGSDSFVYTVKSGSFTLENRITVKVLPKAPDISIVIRQNTKRVINVISESCGSNLVITSITDPKNGKAVIINGQKEVLYVPDPEFAGVDSFRYVLNNGQTGGVITIKVVPEKCVCKSAITKAIIKKYCTNKQVI